MVSSIKITSMKKISFITAIYILLFTCTLCAQDQSTVTSVSLLRITPDARNAAMGETGIASARRHSVALYNPAAAIFTPNRGGLGINYTPWAGGISSGMHMVNAAGYYKIDDEQAITSSLRYFRIGEVEDRDYNNNLVRVLTPGELVFDAGYARKLGEELALGISFRYINTTVSNAVNEGYGSGNALVGDVSLNYSSKGADAGGFTAGAVISNIGSKISLGSANKDYLPAKISLGAAYTWLLKGNNTFAVASDYHKSLVPLIPNGANGVDTYYGYGLMQSYGKGLSNNAMGFSLGAEYGYNSLLFIRVGYYMESESYGGRKYFSSGLGLLYKNLGFDFAYVLPGSNSLSAGSPSGTLRFGLSFNFIK